MILTCHPSPNNIGCSVPAWKCALSSAVSHIGWTSLKLSDFFQFFFRFFSFAQYHLLITPKWIIRAWFTRMNGKHAHGNTDAGRSSQPWQFTEKGPQWRRVASRCVFGCLFTYPKFTMAGHEIVNKCNHFARASWLMKWKRSLLSDETSTEGGGKIGWF